MKEFIVCRCCGVPFCVTLTGNFDINIYIVTVRMFCESCRAAMEREEEPRDDC